MNIENYQIIRLEEKQEDYLFRWPLLTAGKYFLQNRDKIPKRQ